MSFKQYFATPKDAKKSGQYQSYQSRGLKPRIVKSYAGGRRYPYEIRLPSKKPSRVGRLKHGLKRRLKPRRITRRDVKVGLRKAGRVAKKQIKKQLPKRRRKKKSALKKLKKAFL